MNEILHAALCVEEVYMRTKATPEQIVAWRNRRFAHRMNEEIGSISLRYDAAPAWRRNGPTTRPAGSSASSGMSRTFSDEGE